MQRIRPLRPDDHIAWYKTLKYDAVVIECRDGDRTVLIATGRRDALLTLGALVTTPATTQIAPDTRHTTNPQTQDVRKTCP
ncbi:hypothetical protein [Streptomyces vastus]|uniref:hypothetical protein n=1 Tax=Streptomyces vastus TaxID=285451 RepID=UPI0031CE0278